MCKYHANAYDLIRTLVQYNIFHNNIPCTETTDSTNCTNAAFYTKPGEITSIDDGMQRHSYITLPVHCHVIDITREQVLDTLTSEVLTYDWNIYYPVDSNLDGDHIILEITDAKGCPLYSDSHISFHDAGTEHVDGRDDYYKWAPLDSESHLCDDSDRVIGIEQMTDIILLDTTFGQNVYTYFGDTIYLAGSPDTNYYNFKAYIDTVGHYKVEKLHPFNPVLVEYGEHDYLNAGGTLYYVKWNLD